VFKWLSVIIGAGVILYLRSRPQQFIPDELRNLFWDEQNQRWRTDDEVAAILRANPHMIPEPITSGEARVLSHINEIEASATRFNLDSALIAAIISKESSGDSKARGAVGEFGLMQIRLTTAQMFGFTGDPILLLIPGVNVRYGAQYLDWQKKRYSGESDPISWAVAGYNAGTPEVGYGRFRNQEYVDDVIKYRLPRFRKLIDRAHGIYR